MYQHSVPAQTESGLIASPDVASEARADETVASPAGELVATQTPEPAEAADVHEPSHPFRDELARAMQAAAQRERLRIEGRIDDDANSHIAKVRVRASVEADELKRLAEDDVSRIRAWCKVEVERIRAEADIQVGERRDRLEEHLGQHASIIDGEIDRVSEAVEGYRHELEVFFVGLGAVKDPSEIARLADAVPGPPDFELIRAIARADAVGRLSDLEAASVSEMTTSAESGTDDDAGLSEARPIDEAASVEASAEPELVAVMDPALAEKAEAEAIVDAAAEAAAETSDPELVAAGVAASEPNAATRFLRSLTAWGSSDHGNNGHK